jgi:hypothetical protein
LEPGTGGAISKIFLQVDFFLDIQSIYLHHRSRMMTFSTRQAAKQLGIDLATLSRYIRAKKVPAPRSETSGGMTIHFWTQEDIEHLRQLLPKIANGRKTRWQKLREKQKAQPGAAVPHKSRKPKKK